MMKRHFFTFVELIVVTSICVLLAILAIPVVHGAAQQAGKATFCENNLMRLGMALAAYRQDSDDYFVPVFAPTPAEVPGKRVPWTWLLLRKQYVENSVLVCSAAREKITDKWAIIQTEEIFENDREDLLDSNDQCYYYPTYGYNHIYLGNTPVKYVQVKQADKTIAMAEAYDNNNYQGLKRYIGSYQACQNGRLWPLHGEGNMLNVLWTDGHVTLQQVDPAAPMDSAPFAFSNKSKHPENHWDLF